MRHLAFLVVGIGLCAALGVTASAGAQPPSSPTIHRVRLQPDTGVLTIAGTGLGPDLFVLVDGHPMTVLPGASDTQVEVMAPATVLTVPGTYRLMVVDPLRRVGDAFVVASQAATVALGSAALSGTPTAAPGAATAVTAPPAIGPEARAVQRPGTRAVSPASVETQCKTAIGISALANTTGCGNTASGYQALLSNTTGNYNAASGSYALYSNTIGSFNTASGEEALFSNTTGGFNAASGYQALFACQRSRRSA